MEVRPETSFIHSVAFRSLITSLLTIVTDSQLWDRHSDDLMRVLYFLLIFYRKSGSSRGTVGFGQSTHPLPLPAVPIISELISTYRAVGLLIGCNIGWTASFYSIVRDRNSGNYGF